MNYYQLIRCGDRLYTDLHQNTFFVIMSRDDGNESSFF